jgi:hypothetical protein
MIALRHPVSRLMLFRCHTTLLIYTVCWFWSLIPLLVPRAETRKPGRLSADDGLCLESH